MEIWQYYGYPVETKRDTGYPIENTADNNNNADRAVTAFIENLLIFLFLVLSFGRSNVKDFSFVKKSLAYALPIINPGIQLHF